MSKELEAFEIIKNAPTFYVGWVSNIYTRFPFECKLIESALKDYESMKQAKVIVADKKISNDDLEKLKESIGSSEECKVKPLLMKKSQEIESAMSIMKSQLPNLLLIRNTKDYDEFLEKSGDNLTKEEYNIVKEVLL